MSPVRHEGGGKCIWTSMLHGTDVGLAYASVYEGYVNGHNLRHAVTDHCPITTYGSTVYAMRTRTSSSSVPLPWLAQPLDVSQLISPAKETKES